MNAKPERLFVKLCGFVRTADVEAASELELDAIGIVLADDARVPLTAPAVRDLLSAGSPTLTRVAVVGPKGKDECRRILDLGFDAVQVVLGDWFSPTLDGKAVIPVCFDSPDVEDRAHALARAAGAGASTVGPHGLGLLCLDGPSGGGRGVPADWTRAARISRSRPLLLAGGLRADNVQAAISIARPHGVDVSSGVEAEPGRKDPEKMAAFVQAVRAAERELC